MKFLIRIMVLGLMIGLMGHPALGLAQELDPSADKVVKAFVDKLDKGEYRQSFDLTAPVVRETEKPDLWYGRMISERESMGDVKSRNLVSVETVNTFADLPTGEYLKVVLQTEFTAHPDSREIVVLTRNDQGEYQLAGYKIEYNRWPEAVKIIINGLFLVFFIMILLAFITWAIGRVAQSLQKKPEENKKG